MNDYRNYMDSVSVDMALHRKIMSRLTQRTSPVRRSMALSRHASAFVCAALLLISIWAVPRLVPSNVAQPPVVQPNGTVPPVATRPGTLGRQQYALPVSYTHLDVYKRQTLHQRRRDQPDRHF